MASSPSLHLAETESQDVFDRLGACQKLLTAREVGGILAISEKTVYSYVTRNLIPHYKIEANVRFRARDLAEWLRLHACLTPHADPITSKRVTGHPRASFASRE